MSVNERRIAKCTKADIGYEDHGILTMFLDFDYGGSAQGLPGWSLDEWDEDHRRRKGTAFGMECIIRTLRAFGVERWSEIKGRTVFAVIGADGFIAGFEPLPTERGERFVFSELYNELFPEEMDQ